MNILTLSDTESAYLWDNERLREMTNIDLVISCGDLKAEYLSYLATFLHAPILYVHGNHDDCYTERPPDGCICIEDQIYRYKGLRILGLGGSLRYKNGKNQYSQKEMDRRIRHLRFALWRNRGFDLLVTHAPAYGLNDGKDLPHQGFQAFRRLLEHYEPNMMIHGHTHLTYNIHTPRVSYYRCTTIVNAYERYMVSVKTPAEEMAEEFPLPEEQTELEGLQELDVLEGLDVLQEAAEPVESLGCL